MFFRKKSKNLKKCRFCESEIENKFSFCPYCGKDLVDREKEARDFGMLGRTDIAAMPFGNTDSGIADKLIGSMMTTLIKTLDKQFREIDKSEGSFPSRINIRIGPSVQQSVGSKKPRSSSIKNAITEEQIKKMAGLPKVPAKTSVKRLSDKVIYELAAPGIKSPNDIFISKLESGYEIKAIGESKVYVNSLPVNLPLKGIAISPDNILVEFQLGTQLKNDRAKS